jgi:hypothetical protein
LKQRIARKAKNMTILPNLLAPNLDIVFCGTALVGRRSVAGTGPITQATETTMLLQRTVEAFCWRFLGSAILAHHRCPDTAQRGLTRRGCRRQLHKPAR